MKKFFVLLIIGIVSPSISATSISTSSNLNLFAQFDEVLLKIGYVNKNYHYIKESEVAKLFKEIEEDTNKTLPQWINKEMTSEEVHFTPRLFTLVNKITHPLPSKYLPILKYKLSEPAYLAELCKESYKSKVFWVNNIEWKIVHLDVNNHYLLELTINPTICKKISGFSPFD